MKKTAEIAGLPVISISDGNEVGSVEGLVVNASKGVIDYIMVNSTLHLYNTIVIPAGEVLGIGEYALTIESPKALKDISTLPGAVDLLKNNVQVKNTRLMTKKGKLIGETGDFYIDDEDNMKIVGLDFKRNDKSDIIKIIPGECVVTFGKSLIIVDDETEDKLLETLNTAASTVKVDAVEESKNEVAAIETVDSEEVDQEDILSSLDLSVEAPVVKDSEEKIETEESNTGGKGSDLFEERQKQYLIGRRATKTVVAKDGSIIIKENDIIDEVSIEIAKENGKMVELVMNNEAN